MATLTESRGEIYTHPDESIRMAERKLKESALDVVSAYSAGYRLSATQALSLQEELFADLNRALAILHEKFGEAKDDSLTRVA